MDVGDRRYWRCRLCDATFLDPRRLPDRDTERAEYELHRNEPGDSGYRRFFRPLLERMIPRLEPGARGLDHGCGPGSALVEMLRESGFEVETWDPIYDARREVLERRYAFITCTEVVEHLHRPAEVFRLLDRLLEPGGWLGLMTRFQTDDARFADWHYRRDPTHVVFYREKTLELVAERLGWEIETHPPNVALARKA